MLVFFLTFYQVLQSNYTPYVNVIFGLSNPPLEKTYTMS